jgi:hypothetical protein
MDEDVGIGPWGKLGIVEASGVIDTTDPSNAVGTAEWGQSYGTGNPTATTDVDPPPGDLGRPTDEEALRVHPGDDPLTARDAEAEIANSTSAWIGGSWSDEPSE